MVGASGAVQSVGRSIPYAILELTASLVRQAIVADVDESASSRTSEISRGGGGGGGGAGAVSVGSVVVVVAGGGFSLDDSKLGTLSGSAGSGAAQGSRAPVEVEVRGGALKPTAAADEPPDPEGVEPDGAASLELVGSG